MHYPLHLYHTNGNLHYRGYTLSKRVSNQFRRKKVMDPLGVFVGHFDGTVHRYDSKGTCIGKNFFQKGKPCVKKVVKLAKDPDRLNFFYTGEVDKTGNWYGIGSYSCFVYKCVTMEQPDVITWRIAEHSSDDCQKRTFFIGNFVDGKRFGYGILFDKDGRIIYKGNWKNNKPHGKGTCFYANGVPFVIGAWYQGKLSGLVNVHHHEGRLLYTGDWEKYNGDGFLFHHLFGFMTYQGNFREGKPCGRGRRCRMDYSSARLSSLEPNNVYEGNFEAGSPNGQGIRMFRWRFCFLLTKGNFIDGSCHGCGEEYFTSGDRIFFSKGDMVDDYRHGNGKLYVMEDTDLVPFHDARDLQALYHYLYGKRKTLMYHGSFQKCYYLKGKLFYPNGNVQYEGQFHENEYSGYGTLYYPNQKICYRGHWKNHQQFGIGTFYPEADAPIENVKKNGDWYGYAVYRQENKTEILYHGHVKNGKPHGDGIIFKYNEEDETQIEFVFSGEFFDGKYYCENVMYDSEHIPIFEGECDDKGHYVNGIEFTEENGHVEWVDGRIFREEEQRHESKEKLFLLKYLETKDHRLWSSFSKATCQTMLKGMLQGHSRQKGVSKRNMIERLMTLRRRHQNESYNKEDSFDLFGNELTDPVLGSDGCTYDLESMKHLFEVDESGDYKNLQYCYTSDKKRIPNYPPTGHSSTLHGFTFRNIFYNKVRSEKEEFYFDPSH